jgi:hypothetical protein
MIATAQLINDTISTLAPALPFLLKGAEGASEAIGKKIGEAAMSKAKMIWQWLKPKAEERPALLKAAKDIAAVPTDGKALTDLRDELTSLLASQPNLAAELHTMITATTQANTASASGAGAIAIGGSVSDSSLRTNVSE